MKRRDFIKALGALGILPALPKLPEWLDKEPISLRAAEGRPADIVIDADALDMSRLLYEGPGETWAAGDVVAVVYDRKSSARKLPVFSGEIGRV